MKKRDNIQRKRALKPSLIALIIVVLAYLLGKGIFDLIGLTR